ncbi:MAG: DUF1549 and DUF1553 domain-containing protein [Pirellulales bacterium]
MRPHSQDSPTIAALALAGLLMLSSLAVADETYGRHQFEEDVRSHWSFQPVLRPSLPPVSDPSWVGNPIDAFVLAGLDEAGLQPTAPAPRAMLLRRVYVDLIGLPPTPAELDAFLGDASPAAFERVVDDLLSRPQYGERWGRHWLDVVRYAETNGYERDGLKPEAWRYRDWVIEALNRDMPYDQFLVEQLAGDEIPGSDARSQLATTMLRLGPWDDEPADALADRYDQLDDVVGTTSAAFVGMTLRCARCHDHKFEPLLQKDYTRWRTVFSPLKRPQEGRTDLARDIGPHDQVAAHHALTKSLDAQQAELQGKIATLDWQVYARASSNGQLALAATGDETAAKDFAPQVVKMVRDVPAAALAALGHEPGKRDDKQEKLIANHRDKLHAIARELAAPDERGQLADWEQGVATVKSQYPVPLPKGYVWYEEGPTAELGLVFERGDPRTPGAEVMPGFPAILLDQPPPAPTATAHSSGRRLQLARWLTSGTHPLTARVMVNRLWQHHFGDGIVATENDFGVMGTPPSNQALLDWLASELVDGGWQMKRMHRLIVLSQTYQMDSAPNAAAEQIDSTGTLHWRFTPRRMEAEALRDAILAVSGQLNPATFGSSVYPKISREVLETQSRPGDGWNTSPPVEAARRSVYVAVKRTLLVPELEVLDFPSTEETCEQRVVSTVAPQALTFLNGEFIHEQAHAFAERLAREAGPDNTSRIVRAYLLAFSRLPNEQERTSLLQFLVEHCRQIEQDTGDKVTGEAARAQALTALCLVLLNTNEFAYVQ